MSGKNSLEKMTIYQAVPLCACTYIYTHCKLVVTSIRGRVKFSLTSMIWVGQGLGFGLDLGSWVW